MNSKSQLSAILHQSDYSDNDLSDNVSATLPGSFIKQN